MVSADDRASWHTIDSGQLLLVATAGLVMLVAVTHVAAVGLVQPQIAMVFGVLVALGELFRMVLPGDREVAPIGTAAAFGYAFLTHVGPASEQIRLPLIRPDQVPAHSALQVIAVTACGMCIGLLPHIAVGRPAGLDSMARRLLTMAVVALCFRPLASRELDLRIKLVIMVAIVVFACFIEMVVAATIRAEAVRTRFGIALRDELNAKLLLSAATGATGMLVAMATSAMGLVALLLFTAPILVTQVAFRRYAGVRATYLETIRALSRVTEVGGYVETGHSLRVSRLSVAMGRELGMTEPDLLELEYAALMHDIGQLSLGDPIPGGATVLASPSEQRRIAELGAEVIKQTGVLERVAEIVSRQTDPYRVTGAESRTPPPLPSRIIKVANAYDDLVGDSRDRDRSAAVLDRLRLDSTVEYDPTVVEALSRVVERRTRIRIRF